MVEEKSGVEHLLSPYRVLDLTDERGLLCGKMLADLGADVIQVEPPSGNPARNLGPFYQDDVHPEKSLFWWAYAANKRGITLNLHTAGGRELLHRLVKDADFLIESFPPGYLEDLGLGYPDLEAVNPGLVMVSITAFGQDGPYAAYQAPDIVGLAASGILYLTGDSDRPPVRVGFPQFYLHGAAAGAGGALMAHTHRAVTGQGQHVDVSCQQAVAKALANAPLTWDIDRAIIKRMGAFRQASKDATVRITWRCKDGHVNFMLQGGSTAVSTRSMLAWMDEEGMGDEDLKQVNWEELGFGQGSAEVAAMAEKPLDRFLMSHTKAELTRGGFERRILLSPVATHGDVMDHPQLEARGFFKELHHPELEASVTHPGAFVTNEGEPRVGLRRRPPLIGEHNREIYLDELGLSVEELIGLRRGGVI
ncbi:MAG: CoA transferase [Dehalococcoidia bacterium]|nr:CoA transferase [Dehalococcoidia bacterium]MDP6227918.1 CoA transferase [Dehalococcoidia bacterium]MDP7082757.1 CoA transferase [Dehalococcoidia bacterium]MDP7200250.1 CoA transferase [Dehalococcoidia bacterium]MDP7509635.1 CoA transferase [Dehalococcoidia bacterium]